MIDVLRASSTICVALQHGAKAVIPVETVEECKTYTGNDQILAAERKGKKVEGFQHGNSPFEYMDGVLDGKTLVLTTTNGTKAIRASEAASQIVVGCFLNLKVLCDWINEQKEDVLMLCAGWQNRLSLEDTLFAGAVVQQVGLNYNSDAAIAAEAMFKQVSGDLMGAMRNASHFKRLADQGIDKEIEYCLTPDQVPLIPILSEGRLISL